MMAALRSGLGRLAASLVICLPLAAVIAHSAAAEPTTLRVQILWQHQAQFAGLYVAEAKGLYEKAGLQVEIIEGGPGMNPAENLGQGHVDAALAWLPAAVNARVRGWDIINVAQIFRTPGLAIVCRRDAGVRQVADVAGKSIGVWYMGDEITVRRWLAGVGLSIDDVKLIAQVPDGRDLVAGRVDCATAMMYNEYWSILTSHLSPADLVVFRPADAPEFPKVGLQRATRSS